MSSSFSNRSHLYDIYGPKQTLSTQHLQTHVSSLLDSYKQQYNFRYSVCEVQQISNVVFVLSGDITSDMQQQIIARLPGATFVVARDKTHLLLQVPKTIGVGGPVAVASSMWLYVELTVYICIGLCAASFLIYYKSEII